MPTKPLERLMFVQGGRCFFCGEQLQEAEASVEHLFASANGGSNGDDNCVACCKSVNSMLGSMSLKEKFQVVLNQRGQFKCPNRTASAKAVIAPTPKAQSAKVLTSKAKVAPLLQATFVPITEDERVSLVLANLKQRGNSRPRTLKTLTSTVKSLFPKGISEADLTSLIQQLQFVGMVVVEENAVKYQI